MAFQPDPEFEPLEDPEVLNKASVESEPYAEGGESCPLTDEELAAMARGCRECNDEEAPPFPPRHDRNFATYIPIKLDRLALYYRHWVGWAGSVPRDPFGTYYSVFAPAGSPTSCRQAMAPLPEWNTMENTDLVTAPAGTPVYIGPVAAQTSPFTGATCRGGGLQVLAPK